MKLSKIKPNPDNPRIVKDDKFKKLVKSIKEFPKMMELRPIVVDSNNIVLGGNMRLKALKELNYKEIPDSWVKRAEDLTEEETKRFIIADNVGFGAWDWEQLANEWDEEQLIDWGLDIPDFDTEEELEAQEDDYTEPEQMQVDVIKGDLIEFVCDDGRVHRLLCGDSTDSDAVAKLMDGEKADVAFTSPPYNAAKNSHLNGRVTGFDNKYDNNSDNMTDAEYVDFLCDFTNNTLIHSRYSFINIQLLAQNKFTIIDYQYRLKNQLKDILIWNKSQCPPNIVKGAFNTKWEYVFCFSYTNKTRGFPCSWQGKYPNVIDTESASGNSFASIHRATFPVSFPNWIVSKMDFAKIVLDLFLGSGTTLVAAHQLKRVCYGMELDEKYCQVIIDRMQKLDNTLTVKINGKEYKKEAENVPF